MNGDPTGTGWDERLAALMAGEDSRRKPIAQASRRHALGQLQRWLQDRETPLVVEIGCSSGLMIERLRAEFPRGRMVGTDYSASALAPLARSQADLELIRSDLTACPLKTSTVDAVVVLNVLEHIERDQLAVRELFRVLKPGGMVVAEVPAGPELYDVFDKHVAHWRRYRMSGLKALFVSAGFEVLHSSHLGFLLYPVFVVGKRRNRRLLNAHPEEQFRAVAATLRRGDDHPLLRFAFGLEAVLRKLLYLPTGIRCLISCRKPETGRTR